MAAGATGPGPVALQRPFTGGTFPKMLDEFATLIRELTLQDMDITPEERRQMITENLRFDNFVDTVQGMFGPEIKSQDLKSIYRKISTNPDAKVDWSELFGYFQGEGEERDVTSSEDISVFMISKRRRVGDAAGDKKRRDIVQSIRYVPLMDSYLAASQKGVVTIWNSKLQLQASTEIEDTAWLTGCDYLPSIRRVVACTERSIAIWDPRATSKNQNVFVISPLENAPQCLVQVPQAANPLEALLLYGDDQGNINALTLAAKDLTMKNSKHGEKRDSQNIVIEPSRLSAPIRTRQVHDDWVLKVKYLPELRCFASCSPSSTTSFVLEEVDRIFDSGIIRGVGIPKGVNAFDYCAKANILATGGVDKVIRVWHPHIFSRPTGKLMGHLFTIIDIVCNEKDQHIISLSTARVFRVWDIHTLTSLQVFTDNEERPGEKRIYSMIFDNKHERLLTGSSVIDAWPLTRAVHDTMQVPHTHDRPVSLLYMNHELNQLVTICTQSTIKVWEMESGKLVYQITSAHGQSVEITAVTTDRSGYRMATGALDGSLKVWDFGAGQEIKSKPPKASGEDDIAVVGLQYTSIDKERYLIASGWGNKLRLLLDSNENFDLQHIREFSDSYTFLRELPLTPPVSEDPFRSSPLPAIGTSVTPSQPTPSQQMKVVRETAALLQTHELCHLTCLDSQRLAAGCLNGNTIVWSLPECTAQLALELPGGPHSRASSSKRSGSSRTSSSLSTRRGGIKVERRANCCALLIHKQRKIDPAYLEKLVQRRRDVTGSDDEEVEAPRKDSRRSVTSLSKSDLHTVPKPGELEEFKQRMNLKLNESGAQADLAGLTAAAKGPQPTGVQAAASRVEREDTEPHTERPAQVEVPLDVLEEKFITETFSPVIVTGHQDAGLRFWNMEGVCLGSVSGLTRRGPASEVTCLCHDSDCSLLYTGDSKGYLTMWDTAGFLQNSTNGAEEQMQQLLCWRAHLMKIVSLVYIDSLKTIVSASADGSVRVWWGAQGRYVGFYGQPRAFNFPASEEEAASSANSLPYDITEAPLAPVKSKSTEQKLKSQQQQYEYPLIFAPEKWKPFRRSAYQRSLTERPQTSQAESKDKKFFEALIKPKAYNHHLESFTSGSSTHGAVFRALPVYRVKSPVTPERPHVTGMADDDPYSDLFNDYDGIKKKSSARNSDASKLRSKKVSQSIDVGSLPSRQGHASTAATKASKRR